MPSPRLGDAAARPADGAPPPGSQAAPGEAPRPWKRSVFSARVAEAAREAPAATATLLAAGGDDVPARVAQDAPATLVAARGDDVQPKRRAPGRRDGASTPASRGSGAVAPSPMDDASTGHGAASPGGVRFLVEVTDVGGPSREDVEALDRDLATATFKDCRWENATMFLRDRGLLEHRAEVLALLRRGARAFGLWCMTDAALGGMVERLVEVSGSVTAGARQPSPALRQWLAEHASSIDASAAPRVSLARPQSALSRVRKSATITSQMVSDLTGRHWWHVSVRVRRLKLSMTLVMTGISLAIAAPWKRTVTMEAFGGGLAVARVTGIGTLLWTALLFFSVSRSLLKALYSCLPARSVAAKHLDANTQVHIFCGKMIFLFGCIHTLAHLMCTYRIFSELSFERLNSILHCSTQGQMGYLQWLEWPRCPLERRWTYGELVWSSTGCTGFALLGVVVLLAVTGAQSARSRSYEVFWFWHNVGMVLWMVLLFLHGSQGWFGVGIPLVVPVCSLPFACYALDRVLRVARFYLFRGHVRVMSAVIRPGKGGNAEGALTALQVSKPPVLWGFRAGMYAYLNMPEVSPWQWHPFTIVSGREDDTVDFIIAGVGDWTTALAQRCLDYQEGLRPSFPAIAVDGPYAAPATAALCSDVLVAVGAGVGITPFLALMARVVAMLGETGGTGGVRGAALREVHLYWITRSADEFLFGRRHFTRIVSDPVLAGRVILHLHLTSQPGKADAGAYLFREAARRQSLVDRSAFLHAVRDLPAHDTSLYFGAQVPWSWLHGGTSDVLWVRSLVEAEDEEAEAEIARAFTDHWAEGAGIRDSEASEASGASRRRARSGPLLCRRSSASLPGDGPRPRRRSLWRQGCQGDRSDGAHAGNREEAPAIAAVTVRSGAGDDGFMLPIVLGRPDFAMEIQTIGKAWPDSDVDVFACGNAALVDSLRDVCSACTRRSAANASARRAGGTERAQRFVFRFEDFAKA